MKRPVTEMTDDLNRMMGSLGKALSEPEFRKNLTSLITAIHGLQAVIEELEGLSPQRGNTLEDWDKYANHTSESDEGPF